MNQNPTSTPQPETVTVPREQRMENLCRRLMRWDLNRQRQSSHWDKAKHSELDAIITEAALLALELTPPADVPAVAGKCEHCGASIEDLVDEDFHENRRCLDVMTPIPPADQPVAVQCPTCGNGATYHNCGDSFHAPLPTIAGDRLSEGERVLMRELENSGAAMRRIGDAVADALGLPKGGCNQPEPDELVSRLIREYLKRPTPGEWTVESIAETAPGRFGIFCEGAFIGCGDGDEMKRICETHNAAQHHSDRVRELEADKARLDWLEKQFVNVNGFQHYAEGSATRRAFPEIGTLRAAIDAALTK